VSPLGVWYRLRIGPISDKATANKLYGQLKSQRPSRLPRDGGPAERERLMRTWDS